MVQPPEPPVQKPDAPPPTHPAQLDAGDAVVPGRVSFTLIIVRLLVCSFAFTVAVIAASAVGTFALFRGLEEESAYTAAYLGTFGLGTLVIASNALVAWGALVVITESFSLRSVLIYAVGGTLIGLYQVINHLDGDIVLTDPRVMTAAAAGAVGGAVYWLLAGRKAGSFRERRYRA